MKNIFNGIKRKSETKRVYFVSESGRVVTYDAPSILSAWKMVRTDYPFENWEKIR